VVVLVTVHLLIHPILFFSTLAQCSVHIYCR